MNSPFSYSFKLLTTVIGNIHGPEALEFVLEMTHNCLVLVFVIAIHCNRTDDDIILMGIISCTAGY